MKVLVPGIRHILNFGSQFLTDLLKDKYSAILFHVWVSREIDPLLYWYFINMRPLKNKLILHCSPKKTTIHYISVTPMITELSFFCVWNVNIFWKWSSFHILILDLMILLLLPNKYFSILRLFFLLLFPFSVPFLPSQTKLIYFLGMILWT